MVYVDLTARQDHDTSLPTNGNSYFYPAASLSFIFSEVLPELSWLNMAKMRMNYAQTGNGVTVVRSCRLLFSAFGGRPRRTSWISNTGPVLSL